MFAYIQGSITYRNPAFVHLDVGGIGYHIHISLYTYSKIEQLDRVKLYTHLVIKEDAHTIYGFYEAEEKELFIQLLSVSGVGANTARIILSSLNPQEVRNGILTENEALFRQVKGIGAKTAKQIILDLKNKLTKTSEIQWDLPVNRDNSTRQEALSALLALGFNKQNVLRAIAEVSKTQPDLIGVEALIKASLKKLS